MLLADSVTGTIRWPKSLGRAHASTLAEGFTIEYEYNIETIAVTPGGIIHRVDRWVPLPEPSKWDLPEEEDEYAVAFLATALQLRANHITVRFAKNIPWTHLHQIAGPGYLRVTPLGDYFTPIQEGCFGGLQRHSCSVLSGGLADVCRS